MQFKGYRVPFVVLIALLTAALLWGGTTLYRRQVVDRPLARLFADRPAVEEYTLTRDDGGPVVRVRLGRVENLQETYRGLQEDVAGVLPAGTRIEIEDHRDANLREAYDSMAFHLQEALARGNFTEMAAAVSRQGAELDLDRTSLYVDGDFLYVQLEEENRHLYEVLPRTRSGTPGGDQG